MPTSLRVLFIEDSEDDTSLQVRLLEKAGYQVSFRRVESTETLIGALDQKWDVIISDHSMPHFKGTDALRLVRELGIEVPFIFVSGTMGEDAAVAALKVGAQDYLMKTNLGRLVPAIERELREAEHRKQHKILEQQVHQLRRFEAIGRLAGGVAHDFNNLIGAIIGWADIGFEQAPAGTKMQGTFQKIGAQADRAAALTRQLLAFARRQTLQPRNTNVNELAKEEMGLLRNVIGERVGLELSFAEDPWMAWADPGQIEQVLMNLCLNAKDAMPNGGRLLVETRNVEIGEEYHRVHAYALPGRYVLLRVVDTGEGMDTTTMEHIFEPFFSTKEPGKGTGLGLATVYGIVKQHKGFITVESAPGQGTSFQVYIPVGEGTSEEQPDKQASSAPHGGGEKILVAEDNDALREAAKEILESLGYQVIAAPDGETAVRVFEQASDSIDLVLLDVVMPHLNGPEAYAQMSAIKPGIPVIFTTGYASENTLLAVRSMDHRMILQKPYGSAHLAQRLREVLDKKAE
jgi:two-component system, cell cycle sensor histidine kinase and response regulator CckA